MSNYVDYDNAVELFTEVGNKRKTSESMQESLLKSTVGWTGKNLLNDDIYFYESGISVNKSGHTFTIETTTVATQYASLMFRPSINTMYPAGQYKLSLYVSTIGDATARVAIRRSNNSIISAKILSVGANLLEIDTSEDFYISVFPRFEKTNAVTLVFSNPMLRDASITDDTYEPYHESVEEEIEQIYADNGVLGAKNLLPNNATSQTINGITFTVNADGGVTANGTATSDSYIVLSDSNMEFNTAMRYILSGTPELAGLDLYIHHRNVDNTAWIDVAHARNGGDAIFSPTVSGTRTQVVIWVTNGVTVNNLTYYPMLRLASDPDDTYVPYAMTNRELTEAVTNTKIVTLSHNTTNVSSGEIKLLRYGKLRILTGYIAPVTADTGQDVEHDMLATNLPSSDAPSIYVRGLMGRMSVASCVIVVYPTGAVKFSANSTLNLYFNIAWLTN